MHLVYVLIVKNRRMKKMLLLILFPILSFSQEDHQSDCGFACTHDNEIAVGLGVLPSHDFSLGFHAHYIKGIALDNKLGLGLGFETILDGETHNAYNLMCVYRFGSKINGYLSVAYGAGILRSSEHNHEEEDEDDVHDEHNNEVSSAFAQHLELVYELNHRQQMCYGPVLDVGFEKGEFHYMLGVHVGYIF